MDGKTIQDKTIDEIEKTMRKWISDHLEEYKTIPACQIVTSTQGEPVIKGNPAAQEIRAAFKDYCYIVKVQRDLAGEESPAPESVSSVEELRKKLRIAK